MNAISWNCRGLGNSRAVRALGDLIKSHKPNILFLIETLSDEKRIKEISSKFGFDNCWSVDSYGRGGGLALLWDRSVHCDVVGSDKNHIDVHILRNDIPVWRLTGYYGFPERSRRKESWEFIKALARKSVLPWCLLGDFNDMVNEGDKKGIHKHPQALLDGFKRTIEECNLTELDLMGGKYTWEKSRGSKEWVRERIDRAFASASWWQLFPLCKLTVHHTIYSDHDPIQVNLYSMDHSRKKFRFRFENTWLKEKSFHGEVASHWKKLNPIQVLPKLLELSTFMEKWGRKFFNKFREKIQKQKEILSLYADCVDERQIKRYFEERNKLEELLVHEETYWKQRAKSFWLLEGDSNSKFFHAYATTRKKRNLISKLITDSGEVVADQAGMCEVVKEYFVNLFSHDEELQEERFSSYEAVITEEQNRQLVEEFTFEEFSAAIKQMHPDKSAGPDGLNPAFYQNFWSLLGNEVFLSCKMWLHEVIFPAKLNETTIVLIPKKENADTMKDLRPIALCNVLYKIIAKVLSNRLKVILPGIIAENQSAFVPNRSISDNVLIAFEMLHFMKQKKSGSEGEVALKLDVSKAYDRVDWGFLKHQMTQMGFSEKWISWIMMCVTTVSYSVNFNGTQVGPVLPQRGLRQGDPLSPYLFLLCVEGLSSSIKKSAEEGKINGCRIHVQAPAVTHLLFADDSFLFCKANMDEVKEIKSILQRYEIQSGQAINFQKSGIYFSSNVRVDKQMEIKQLLGVHSDLSEGKYLGLPSLIGKSKTKVFNFLKDRMWSKIQGWSVKCLSKAGKAVLLRNVAQAVPSYAMSCFLIPKSLCKELERMMNSFWWGSKDSSRKGIRWQSWTSMSMSKSLGGLGFRDLYGFNLSLLGKQCWSFLKNPNSLVARIFKARYFSNTSLFDAVRGGGVSFVWSGIWQAKEMIKKGFKWVLGDGKSIKVFEDQWVRGNEQYRVDSTVTDTHRGMKVCELFAPGDKQWDNHKVNNLFSNCDAKKILAIPIPRNQVSDRIAWMHTVDGQYTVKSGYSFWHKHFSDCRQESVHNGWKKLWNLAVPHKVKIFLWRVCKNTVPVRNLLRGRGVQTTIMCPMCERDVEHLMHVFLDCPFVQACWRGLGLEFDTSLIESLPEWLLQTLATEAQDKLVQVATVLWGVWMARNIKVWDGKIVTPELALQWSVKHIQQWQEAQAHKERSGTVKMQRQQNVNHWVVPPEGKVKINVDASVYAGVSSFSVGMVLRNHLGQFCRARNLRREGEVTVYEAEAWGVLEAIRWALDLGISNVEFETDSMLTVQALHKGATNYLEVGNLLHESRCLINTRQDFSISFVKKQANTVAHILARVPCEANCFNDFFSPPQVVLENLMYDVLLI